jgi:plastocyanin
MTSTPARIPTAALSALVALLYLPLAGCGGRGPDADVATVITEPKVEVPAPAPASTTEPKPAVTEPTPPAKEPSTPPSTEAPASSAEHSPTTEGWGTLKGTVSFDGEAPTPKVLVEQGKAPKNPEYCAIDAPITEERLVVDGATKGVKNVLVYIPKPTAVHPEAKKAASQARVEFDQRKCIFKPHVLAVMAGATIVLKNSDGVTHNVNSSKLKNNATNPSLSPGNSQPFATTLPERVPGPVSCDVHNWMKAYWLVTDSPYFAVTTTKGRFEIPNVPAGIQKVVVWQEATAENGFLTPPSGQEVEVKSGETTTFDLKFSPGKIRPE